LLPAKNVDLLRAAAGYLFMNSDDFVAGIKRLDPSWKPRQVALFDEVCGPFTDMSPGEAARGDGNSFSPSGRD
jgi:hypothetical protein